MIIIKIILAAITGFDFAVALFATNQVAIDICKYLQIIVSIILLVMSCIKTNNKQGK